jgi:hypothetical protein
LTVDELRPAERLGDKYEAEVSQFQSLMYNILILRKFHNNQKEVLIDKLRHDLYPQEWKTLRNQDCK